MLDAQAVGKWLQLHLNMRLDPLSILMNAISDIHPITYGVPQGSILGPTLFVIYINDLPSVNTHSKIFMYADDTALTVSRKETKAASILIQRDLNKVNQWMCSNKLNLNAKKSQYLVTSTPYKTKSNFSLSISAVELKRTEAYKYLGITIDEHLKFNLHINNISGIISSKSRTIIRLSHFLPTWLSLLLYKSLIIPHLDYAALV